MVCWEGESSDCTGVVRRTAVEPLACAAGLFAGDTSRLSQPPAMRPRIMVPSVGMKLSVA